MRGTSRFWKTFLLVARALRGPQETLAKVTSVQTVLGLFLFEIFWTVTFPVGYLQISATTIEKGRRPISSQISLFPQESQEIFSQTAQHDFKIPDIKEDKNRPCGGQNDTQKMWDQTYQISEKTENCKFLIENE